MKDEKREVTLEELREVVNLRLQETRPTWKERLLSFFSMVLFGLAVLYLVYLVAKDPARWGTLVGIAVVAFLGVGLVAAVREVREEARGVKEELRRVRGLRCPYCGDKLTEE